MSKKRIGIYGGSFNPIHNGHLSVAKKVIDLDIVDEVWFTVSLLNPFKVEQENQYASYAKRFEMVKIATEGMERVNISRIEEGLGSPSRTINTLNALEALSDGAYEFHVIFGSDAWNQIDKFYDYELIVRNYPITIVTRPGCKIDLKSPGMRMSEDKEIGKDMHLNFIDIVDEYDISSTSIRNDVAKGKNIYDRVPENVAKYILKNRLYREKPEDMAKLALSLLEENNMTVSTAESCTGGWVAEALTSVEGASKFVSGGIVAYNNQIKENLLGVSHETLQMHTAVSKETALEMAVCACEKLHTDCAVSTTGYASGHPESGNIFVCAHRADIARCLMDNLNTRLDDRQLNREIAVIRGLSLLQELLRQGRPLLQQGRPGSKKK